jgi:hypothetical protein
MKPEAYIYIYKLNNTYYIQTVGDEDEIVIMMSSAIVSDPRLTDASHVAQQYLTDFGAENLN